jgi:hypothetical protein
MLRLTVTWESCPGIKLGADCRIDPFGIKGLQMCGLALCALTGNLFDLALPLLIHLKVNHLREESNAVLTAVLDVDREGFLAGPGGTLIGERVVSGFQIKGYEATKTDAGETLRAVKDPPALQTAEGLFALGKVSFGYALH